MGEFEVVLEYRQQGFLLTTRTHVYLEKYRLLKQSKLKLKSLLAALDHSGICPI
ncbi:hypothetical protein QT971_09380 [Microcoleus sp. herbarium19]|uniref:hypothetical protein n=1 Tax=Microcoleus sp. herbarium13 TaxID=3055438 RepID=UPI002FD06440